MTTEERLAKLEEAVKRINDELWEVADILSKIKEDKKND